MNDVWNKKRENLQLKVINAVLELYSHTDAPELITIVSKELGVKMEIKLEIGANE